jgi:hypothetical protein
MAQAQRDAERMMDEARQSVAEIQQTALQQVEMFMAKMKAFMANWEGLSRSLEALARDQADSLETIASTRAEVESDVLPLLRDLLRGLRAGADIGLREPAPAPAAPPPPPPVAPKPVSAPSPRAGHREPAQAPPVGLIPPKPAPPPKSAEPVRARPAPSPAPSPAPEPERVPVVAAAQAQAQGQAQAEIVVSPVSSYLQASRLVTAVSKIKGVKTARLRAYAKGMITIDVMTEEGSLSGIGADLSSGFPVDVVEETDTRLVLRLANGRIQAATEVKESS